MSSFIGVEGTTPKQTRVRLRFYAPARSAWRKRLALWLIRYACRLAGFRLEQRRLVG